MGKVGHYRHAIWASSQEAATLHSQGFWQKEDRLMSSSWDDTGKVLAYELHLWTEIGDQNGHGHCKHTNIWEYTIS